MNQVAIIGNMTKDPEIRYTQSGMAVCTFSVAINRYRKDGQPDVDYPRVTCWGKTAENVGQYCKKGSKVGVTGSIRTGSYDGTDGKKVYTTEVQANRVEFLNRVQEQNGEQSGYHQPGPAQQQVPAQPPQPAPQPPMPAGNPNGTYDQANCVQQAVPGFEALNDDDIPF